VKRRRLLKLRGLYTRASAQLTILAVLPPRK
jgi:hypothetical protein